MSDIDIRVANAVSFESAREILDAAYSEYASSFPPENWAPYLQDILDLQGRSAESELLVAERDGEMLGCVSYFPPGSKAEYPTDATSEPGPLTGLPSGSWPSTPVLAAPASGGY